MIHRQRARDARKSSPQSLGEAGDGFSLAASRGNQHCQPLDFRPAASELQESAGLLFSLPACGSFLYSTPRTLVRGAASSLSWDPSIASYHPLLPSAYLPSSPPLRVPPQFQQSLFGVNNKRCSVHVGCVG